MATDDSETSKWAWLICGTVTASPRQLGHFGVARRSLASDSGQSDTFAPPETLFVHNGKQ